MNKTDGKTDRGRRWLPIAFLVGCAAIGIFFGLRARARKVPASGDVAAEVTTAGKPGSTGAHAARGASLPTRATKAPPGAPRTPSDQVPVGLRTQQLLGTRTRDIYNAETRDPIWAPAMENQVRNWFRPEALAQFPGMEVVDIECRTSSCRIEVKTTPELRDKLQAASSTKWIYGNESLDDYFAVNGRPATLTNRVKARDDLHDQVLMLFGERDIDPAKYQEWAEHSLRKKKEAQERKRAEAALKYPGVTNFKHDSRGNLVPAEPAAAVQ